MVAVGVVGAEAAELVVGRFGDGGVVGGGVGFGGTRARGAISTGPVVCGAPEVAVGDDRPVVGAFGSAVVGWRSWTRRAPMRAERSAQAVGRAVGVAGVGEDVADGDAVVVHALEGGDEVGRVDGGRR